MQRAFEGSVYTECNNSLVIIVNIDETKYINLLLNKAFLKSSNRLMTSVVI